MPARILLTALLAQWRVLPPVGHRHQQKQCQEWAFVCEEGEASMRAEGPINLIAMLAAHSVA